MKQNAYHVLLYQASMEEYGLAVHCPDGARTAAYRFTTELRRLADPALHLIVIRVVDDKTVWIVSCPAEKMSPSSDSTSDSTDETSSA